MIAAWMLYCTLCAAGLAGVALLAERALFGTGGSIRHVWVAAMILSILIPAAAFRFATRPIAPAAIPVASSSLAVEPSLESAGGTQSPVAAASRSQSSMWNWRATVVAISRANRTLVVGWFALSAALAFYFLVGVVALAWMRRRWQPQDVLGVPVLVSERTGPAVVGALSPAIVMPEWALDMEPRQLALMLRHEEEHRRAKDVQLLTAAQLVLIAMPWNAALWWLMVRLGMAVELDCDARVLREADARSYGDLLLEVARPRRGPRLIGATAFAERAEQLERRIRAIARRRQRASLRARAATALAAFAVVSIAWVAPRPPVPARIASSPAASTLETSIAHQSTPAAAIDSTPRPTTKKIATDVAKHVELPAVTVAASKRDTSRRASIVPNSTVSAPIAPAPRSSPLADSVFARLFEGIQLSSDQAARAQNLLEVLAVAQLTQDVTTAVSMTRATTAAAAIQAHRDSALRALLPNDVDRALFDTYLATIDRMSMGGGRRGRSGGGSPPPGADAIGGMRGRGRVGGPTLTRDAQLSVSTTDESYRRLFGAMALTPDQEASARAIIDASREEMIAVMPELPMTRLWLLNTGGVAMRAQSRDTLVALLTNDADRSLLDSRIVVETRTIVKRGVPQAPR